jgi:DNA-binding transcriptional regulator YhcF (GntR family)
MTKRLEVSDAEGFRLAIDRDAEVPIGVQIAWALRAQIRDGRFGPSQRLPGLRELAETTGVNISTARAVYQRLEHEGLIDSRQGSGTFVASSKRTSSTVGTIAGDAARQAHATGVDPREVATALYIASSESPGGPAPVDRAAERRRQLRDQIVGLERTLGELEAGHPGVAPMVPTATATRGGSAPRLLDIDELEQVRTSLVRRLATVQTAIDALGREDTSNASDATTVPKAKRKAATTSRRAGRSASNGRPRVETRPAPAGA